MRNPGGIRNICYSASGVCRVTGGRFRKSAFALGSCAEFLRGLRAHQDAAGEAQGHYGRGTDRDRFHGALVYL